MIKLSRNKNKYKVDFKSDDMYEYYLEKNQDRGKVVGKAQYTKILKQFLNEKFSQMMHSNEEFLLPARLGSIRLRRRKRELNLDKDGNVDKTNLKMDYRKTLDYWEKQYPGLTIEEIKEIPDRRVIYHLNEHTDGDSVHFVWDKLISNIRNQSAYRYIPTRTLKRTLAHVVKTLNKQYYG